VEQPRYRSVVTKKYLLMKKRVWIAPSRIRLLQPNVHAKNSRELQRSSPGQYDKDSA
jgi:hypothetical protein